MKIESLHHTSIMVSDLERAQAFYCGILGLEALPRPNGPIKGAWLSTGNAQVHLIVGDVETPPLTEQRSAVESRGLATHFALEVESAEAAVEFLASKGQEPLGDFVRRPDGSVSAFFRDPDGNLVEFIQSGP